MLIVLVALCPVTQTISPEERAFSGRAAMVAPTIP
jgi:hypothetical protein